MSCRVRHPIGPPVQAPTSTTLRIRTRLQVSAADQAVIVALGAHLGRLARTDLARRCATGLDQEAWAERKRAITRESSSRWAGAITKALAEDGGASSITIEELGFWEMRSTGRERYGARRWFRRVISGMPTAKFRDRLVAMASRRGIAMVGVPAAYSSIWGKEHGAAPMSAEHQQVSGHTAAAVVTVEEHSGTLPDADRRLVQV